MAEPEISRKLAVIVHADVEGSTALVQRNETLAHQRINDAFQRFSSIIQSYGGAVREIRGDALVAEFARPSDAVCAALKFQNLNGEHNAEFDDEIVPVVRIGIALGEEVFAHDTVTGAGVVLAQRVEQLSVPGGVCVTGAIHEAIPNRMPFDQENLGEQALKGFDEPVRVYQVTLKPREAVPDAEVIDQLRTASPTRRLIAAFAALAVVVAAGGILWVNPWVPEEVPASIPDSALPLPDEPSIAVLPFTNMSNNPDQDYFVDGMTEDLITDLSKISGLFVIARHSSFAYKGRSPDVRQVARELGVRYVLEGSVRRAGNQLRINAQLIDAFSGGHVWAERYDGALGKVFSIQDTITDKIVGALAVQLTQEEQQRTAIKGTENIEAYDAFLKGWSQYTRDTPQGFFQAIPYFEKAVELDPAYGRAYAALASLYYLGVRRDWERLFSESLSDLPPYPNGYLQIAGRAFEYLQKAMNYPTALAHGVQSEMYVQNGRHAEAVAEAEQAIATDPNDPAGYVSMAKALTMAGRPAEAVPLMEKAMRLDPHYPPSYLAVLALAYFGLENYERAGALMDKALKLSAYLSPLPLIAAYGHLGRKEEAENAIKSFEERFNRLMPGYPVSIRFLVDNRFPLFEHEEDKNRFVDGLRKAGMS